MARFERLEASLKSCSIQKSLGDKRNLQLQIMEIYIKGCLVTVITKTSEKSEQDPTFIESW